MNSRLLFAAAAGLLMAACATDGQDWLFGDYNVERVEAMPAEGDAFQQALRREYVRLARFERDVEFDWGQTDAYLRRALAAGRGPVAPKELDSRPLPPEAQPDLAAARARLMTALEDGGGEAAPEEAARAQGGFDCWLEQQAENYQPHYIANCRKQFETAIAEVEDAIKPPPIKSVVVLLPDEAGVVGRVKVETAQGAETLEQARAAARLDDVRARWRKPFEIDEETVDARFGRAISVPRERIRRYIVYFEDESAELTADSEALMPEVVAVVASMGKKVSVTGHSDSFGREGRNHAIAFQRALTIRDMLVAGGVPTERVSPTERGQLEPAQPTRRGVKEPANRRAVIEFD